jgi:hypothetical protein
VRMVVTFWLCSYDAMDEVRIQARGFAPPLLTGFSPDQIEEPNRTERQEIPRSMNFRANPMASLEQKRKGSEK